MRARANNRTGVRSTRVPNLQPLCLSSLSPIAHCHLAIGYWLSAISTVPFPSTLNSQLSTLNAQESCRRRREETDPPLHFLPHSTFEIRVGNSKFFRPLPLSKAQHSIHSSPLSPPASSSFRLPDLLSAFCKYAAQHSSVPSLAPARAPV